MATKYWTPKKLFIIANINWQIIGITIIEYSKYSSPKRIKINVFLNNIIQIEKKTNKQKTGTHTCLIFFIPFVYELLNSLLINGKKDCEIGEKNIVKIYGILYIAEYIPTIDDVEKIPNIVTPKPLNIFDIAEEKNKYLPSCNSFFIFLILLKSNFNLYFLWAIKILTKLDSNIVKE